jgi:hypothetical protein
LEDNCWSEIVTQQLPIKPQILVDYEGLTVAEKLKINYSTVISYPSVKDYIEKSGKAISHNLGMYGYLSEIKQDIPDNPEHLEMHKEIDRKIIGFKEWLTSNCLNVFKQETPQETLLPVATKDENKILDIFGGSILGREDG